MDQVPLCIPVNGFGDLRAATVHAASQSCAFLLNFFLMVVLTLWTGDHVGVCTIPRLLPHKAPLMLQSQAPHLAPQGK